MNLRTIKVSDVGKFEGKWIIFSEAQVCNRNKRIIDLDTKKLRWVLDSGRNFFADIREY